MNTIAWCAPAIARAFVFISGCAAVCALGIEGFENEATVVAEQFVHADHSQKEDGIIVIPLDPFAFASWTLHAAHSNRVRRHVVRIRGAI